MSSQRIARRVFVTAILAIILPGASVTHANPASKPETDTAAESTIKAHYVYFGKKYVEPAPLSLLDKILDDEGVQGSRVAIKENNMTGRLIGHQHDISEVILPADADVVAKARELFANGEKLIIADLEHEDLLSVSDLPEAKDAIILNIRDSDDDLRQEQCRQNVFHLPPSWAMRADALAQYMTWKKWRRWLLISGQGKKDIQYAAAVRRAAAKFGGKIVEEKTYKFDAGSRRTDSGHQQIQTQMPLLTQTSSDYDVLFVTDADEAFGDYLMYRTFDPKPVIGTHGLVAVGWHRSFEQYAGTQMQNRFERQAHRTMTERDYYGWLAVRIFGEAVLRTNSNDVATLKTFMLSKDFEVAGFKGVGMTFRTWDQQLRQPVLLAGPRALVSISPQDGFLHQHNQTDTMGFDKPESRCRLSS